MELRHLRYFCAVAESLNFSRAAEKIRVAQPALSRQIKDLEEEIGVKLFQRTTAQVKLTEAGRFFLQQTEKLLGQLDVSITAAQQIARGSSSQLNIGVDWSMPNLAIAAATQKFRTEYPSISVELREIRAHEHVAALRGHRIDIGFMTPFLLGARDDLQMAPLYTSSIDVIVASNHPLAKKKSVRLRELKEERWLSLDKTRFPGFKTILLQLLRPALFTPRLGQTASSLEGIIGLASAGEGIALMPSVFVPHPPSSIRMLTTDCAPFELIAVWLKSAASPHLETYIRILRAEMSAPPAKRPKTK